MASYRDLNFHIFQNGYLYDQVTASPAQVASNIIAREKFELENQYRYQFKNLIKHYLLLELS